MIELQYKLEISQAIYDDVAAYVAKHEITMEQLLEEFFTQISATRMQIPFPHILSRKSLADVKESLADFAAGRSLTGTVDDLFADLNSETN